MIKRKGPKKALGGNKQPEVVKPGIGKLSPREAAAQLRLERQKSLVPQEQSLPVDPSSEGDVFNNRLEEYKANVKNRLEEYRGNVDSRLGEPVDEGARLKERMSSDEGSRLKVYADSLGNPTVGIGHKVLPGDNLKVGDMITAEQESAYYDQDISTAKGDAQHFVGKDAWEGLTTDRQEVLTNMAYNLGGPNLSTFKNFKANILEGDWEAAGAEMLESKWAGQVGDRANRLSERFIGEVKPSIWDEF